MSKVTLNFSGIEFKKSAFPISNQPIDIVKVDIEKYGDM